MIDAADEVTVSYQTSASVLVRLASGMPDLNADDLGVTIYDQMLKEAE